MNYCRPNAYREVDAQSECTVSQPAICRSFTGAIHTSATWFEYMAPLDSRAGVARSPSSRIPPGKRAFDLVFAILFIIATLPVMAIIFLATKISSPGPALFRQERIGENGCPFSCMKFRTMVVDAQDRLEQVLAQDEEARVEWELDQKLRNDPRITPIGRFLRASSLDELPQLFNILFGQMSVVGPRPIVQNEIRRYGADFAYYCSVRPGLTGLWQTSGRNDTSYEERVGLDVEYAKNLSLARDIAICFKTVPALLTSRGCY